MERTDQIIELISKANQSFDSGVIRDGQKLTREALKLVKIQGKIPNKLKHKPVSYTHLTLPTSNSV